MRLIDFLSLLLVVTLFVNLGHWNGRRSESIVYWPRSGLLSVLFGVWAVTVGLVAIGCCLGAVTLETGGGISFCWFIALNTYSVWERHHRRKCAPSQQQ